MTEITGLAEVANPTWGVEGDDAKARPLPLEVDEITPEWLTAALSIRAPGARVNSCQITRVRHGFTSIAHVTIDLNEAGRKAGIPSTIVVKGGFTPHSRTYSFAYAMEAHGYRQVWPHLNLNMPKTYFVDIDLQGRQSIIIMEDLNARGVKFGHGLEPLGFDLMRRRLTALAGLHAQTWDSPDLKPGGRFHSVLANFSRLMRFQMQENGYIDLGEEISRHQSHFKQKAPFLSPEGWETIWEERMSQNAAASMHFRDREWTRRALEYMEGLCDRLPNVIVHGDTHLGNHFEEPDGTPGFFDSLLAREPPYFELAYTITTGLDPYDRRKWERSLIGHYIDQLARHGVTLDFDETVYYYSLFQHHGFLVFIINDPVWQSPAFNTVHVWRFCAAMMDNRTKELLDAALA